MDEPTWLTKNRQAIMARLQPLQEADEGTLYAELHGAYFVIVTKGEGNMRLWLLDPQHPDSGVMQSEMRLDDPLALYDDYTQAAMLGLLWQPQPKRVYVAGLGGGCVPLVLHHYFPTVEIDCTEIEPAIIAMATAYFGLAVDERLQVTLADGREWLVAQSDPYDFIFVDVFLDRGYVPYRMSTVEFYMLCRQRLTADGVLVANFLASDPYFLSRLKSLQQVFPMIYVNPLPVGNILVYASANTTLDHDALIAQAMQVQETHHFAFPFAIRSLDLRQNLYTQFAGLALAEPFFDQSPPDGYFDLLPGPDNFFAAVVADTPCFCGSGLPFGKCHGLLMNTTGASSSTE